MANRVSAEELSAYIQAPAGLDLTPYLDDANTLVNAKLGVTPSGDSAIVKLIEKNLAAHLYLLGQEGGGVIQSKKGESSETYASSKNDAGNSGISSTRFGQMVLSLDSTGSFISMDKPAARKAQFRVL